MSHKHNKCCKPYRKHIATLYHDGFERDTLEDPAEVQSVLEGKPVFQPTNANWSYALPGFLPVNPDNFSRSESSYTIFDNSTSLGNLRFLNTNFAVKKGQTIVVKSLMSTVTNVDTEDLPAPWIPNLYKQSADTDPRPLLSGMVVQYYETRNREIPANLTTCFFNTKHSSWCFYDAENSLIQAIENPPFLETTPGPQLGWDHGTLGKELDTSEDHCYKTVYHRGHDQKDSYMEWYIDGELVRRQEKLGFLPEIQDNDVYAIRTGEEGPLDPDNMSIWIVASGRFFGYATREGQEDSGLGLEGPPNPPIFWPDIVDPSEFLTGPNQEYPGNGSITLKKLKVDLYEECERKHKKHRRKHHKKDCCHD